MLPVCSLWAGYANLPSSRSQIAPQLHRVHDVNQSLHPRQCETLWHGRGIFLSFPLPILLSGKGLGKMFQMDPVLPSFDAGYCINQDQRLVVSHLLNQCQRTRNCEENSLAPDSVISSTSTRFTCLTALTARTSRSALPELTANGRMLHLISNLYAEKRPQIFTQHSCNKSPTPPKRLYCKNIESSNYNSLRIDCQFGPARCLTHEDTLASKVLAVCAVNTNSRFSGKLTRLTRF